MGVSARRMHRFLTLIELFTFRIVIFAEGYEGTVGVLAVVKLFAPEDEEWGWRADSCIHHFNQQTRNPNASR